MESTLFDSFFSFSHGTNLRSGARFGRADQLAVRVGTPVSAKKTPSFPVE